MARPFYERGRYICQVVDQGVGESREKKTPQVVIRFKVLQTENGESVHQYERTIYLYLTENSIERTVACLRELGYTRDSFKYLDKSDSRHHDLTGQEFTAFCDYETYNGEEREKWGIALENAFEMTPTDPKKLRELDSLFGKHLKSTAAPEKRQPKPQPVAAGDAPSDDDVPF